jgi:hypothetical protein
MPWQDDLRSQLRDALHSGIEVVNFKPQCYAVAVRFVFRVTNGPVMVFDIKTMQLQDQQTVCNEALIFGAAVRALTTK